MSVQLADLRLGPVVTMRSRSLGRRLFRMLVMSRIRHAVIVLTARSPAKKSGQNIPKNRCRTTIAERMVETLAELPFIGDQVVCLSHDQAWTIIPPGAKLRGSSMSQPSKDLGSRVSPKGNPSLSMWSRERRGFTV